MAGAASTFLELQLVECRTGSLQQTMSEDDFMLLFSYLIFGLTLGVLTLISKNRLKTLTINLIVSGLYSAFLFYNLTFNSSGGSGLVWLMSLLVFIGLHWIINLVGIVLTFFKRQ